jgi:hypothetical protein
MKGAHSPLHGQWVEAARDHPQAKVEPVWEEHPIARRDILLDDEVMQISSMQLDAMLRSGFLKAELDFLKSIPRFAAALSLVKSADQFESLCALGQQLLTAHHCANRSAQQFRETMQRAAA